MAGGKEVYILTIFQSTGRQLYHVNLSTAIGVLPVCLSSKIVTSIHYTIIHAPVLSFGNIEQNRVN